MVININIGDNFYGKYGRILITNIVHRGCETIITYKYDDGDDVQGRCFLPRFQNMFKRQVKNTRLAKKMFPNAEESEDGEWLYV
jgi:hypothetical protein